MAFYSDHHGQEFRCPEKNHYNQHQFYAAPAYAPEFHQEHPQSSAQSTPLEEHLSWVAEFKKKQQELMDQINSQMKKLSESVSQTTTLEPQHQLPGSVPMEYPPEVQAPKEVFDDTEKLRDTVSFQLELEDKEAAAVEDGEKEEIQVNKDDIIQERDESGLSNPLDDMFPCEPSAITLHYMIPLLKEELKNDLLEFDHKNPDCDTVYDAYDDNTYYSHAGIMLKDACFKFAYISPMDTYHPHHVLYCYTYIIGYSIDDLVGVNPITCASCTLFVWTFRILSLHYSLRLYMVRVDIPWDPGGFMVWC